MIKLEWTHTDVCRCHQFSLESEANVRTKELSAKNPATCLFPLLLDGSRDPLRLRDMGHTKIKVCLSSFIVNELNILQKPSVLWCNTSTRAPMRGRDYREQVAVTCLSEFSHRLKHSGQLQSCIPSLATIVETHNVNYALLKHWGSTRSLSDLRIQLWVVHLQNV